MSRRCTAGALRDRRSLRTLNSDVARRRAEWAPTLDDRTDGIEQPQRAMPIAEPEKLCHVRLARVAIYWEIREALLRQRLDGFADRHRLCNSPELERASLLAREHPRLPRQRDPHVWKLRADRQARHAAAGGLQHRRAVEVYAQIRDGQDLQDGRRVVPVVIDHAIRDSAEVGWHRVLHPRLDEEIGVVDVAEAAHRAG